VSLNVVKQTVDASPTRIKLLGLGLLVFPS